MVMLKAAPSEAQKRPTRLSPRSARPRNGTAAETWQEEEQRTSSLATVPEAAEGLRSATDRLEAISHLEPAVWMVLPISAIEIPGEGQKYTYPLRGPVSVLIRDDGDQVEARVRELDSIVPLRGRGRDVLRAMHALTWEFHRVVEKHWWTPPHDRSETDERVRRVLAHLVDWDRYAVENPVEQPLWGRIDKALAGGGIQVHWFMGPDLDRRDYDAPLVASDVHPALQSLKVGEWFYGSARRYPDKLLWIAAPEVVPDPRDQAASKAAWDRIPVVVMDNVDAWPARKED